MTNKKELFAIALPAMAENILQTLMGGVDGYLVAVLGLSAVSGVSVANSILAIYQALFIAIGTAVSSLVASHQKDKEQSQQYQKQAILLTIVTSVALSLVSVVGGRPLLKLLGVNHTVLTSGVTYLAIVGGGAFGLGLLTTLGAILRTTGKPKWPMYVSLLTNLLNAVLSALAVFVFKFGLTGVALSTVLSRIFGIVILVLQLPELWKRKHWQSQMKDLLVIALPAAGERLMMRSGDVVVLMVIVQLGTAVVGGYAIGETLTQFNYLPGMAMATAVVILMTNRKIEDQQRLVREAYLLTAAMMLVMSGVVLSAGPWLIPIFTQDNSAVDASHIVLIASFLGTLSTAGTLVYTAVWQGLGNAKRPLYATTLGMWIIRIGVGYLFAIVLDLGFWGVWLATILDNTFRWLYLRWQYRRLIKIS